MQLAVEKFGRLDIAVNNAGIVHSFVRLPQVTSEEARRVVEVDLLGVFYAMKHQIPRMARQFRESGKGGVIVNVASVAGLSGAPKLSVYAAAKHGVVGADALGGRGICQQGHSHQRRLPRPHQNGDGRRFRPLHRSARSRSACRAHPRRADEARRRGRRDHDRHPVPRRPGQFLHDRPCAGARRRHRGDLSNSKKSALRFFRPELRLTTAIPGKVFCGFHPELRLTKRNSRKSASAVFRPELR
ncbi:hypothetical protein MPLA_140261 [Mesorhizobium sp. ORS 3359]|nr:hypothetical protein MPLA_140261 [Mesorhizobium sp. ORS 3359]